MATIQALATPTPEAARPGRKRHRTLVSVPAFVRFGGGQYGVRVHNLSSGGAMIETDAPLRQGAPIVLSCGTLEASGLIVWQRSERFGIQFLVPVGEERVLQQLHRSKAAADRRRARDALLAN
jgi:PilZ domain-containing protein